MGWIEVTELKEAAGKVREALADLGVAAGGLASTITTAFGKCPICRDRLVTGYWLKWCDNRTCQQYVGPK